jgi:hypothetical protein
MSLIIPCTTFRIVQPVLKVGHDSSIGIATGWTIQGSNPGRGQDFSHSSGPALGLTQPPIQWVPGLYRG